MGLGRRGLLLAAVAAAACEDGPGGIGRLRGELDVIDHVDLGDVPAGLTASASLDVSNHGNAHVNVTRTDTAENFTGTDYEFTVGPYTLSLPPTTERKLELRFSPYSAQAEPIETSFTLHSDIDDEARTGQKLSRTVKVTARGVKADLDVDPRPVDFGVVLAGDTRVLDVKLTNPLRVPVDVITKLDSRNQPVIPVSGGNGRFAIVSAVGADGSLLPPGEKLAPGASITVQTSYTPDPATLGRKDLGRWVLAICPDPLCEFTVDMRGEGTNAAVECAPAVVEFGEVNPGRMSVRPITCTNASVADVEIRGWKLGPNTASAFSVPMYQGPAVMLPGGGSFTLDVTFSPTLATLGMPSMGSVVIKGWNPRSGLDLDPAEVQLSGTAGGPTINATPNLLSFGQIAVGTTRTRRLLVENAGYSPLVVTDIAPDAMGAGQFTVSKTSFTLASGTSTVVDVTFAPTAPGMVVSDLLLSSNDSGNPVFHVAMNGVALDIGPCSYQLTPTNVSFGVVPIGTSVGRQVRIENTGPNECLVNDLELTGTASRAFALAGGPQPTLRIPVGGYHEASVEYTPTGTGSQMAQLEMWISSPLNSRPTVPLFGTGLARTEAMCPPDVTIPAGTPTPLNLMTTTIGTTIRSVQWVVLSAPAGGMNTPNMWTPNPPNQAMVQFRPTIVGVYTLRATVFDDLGTMAQCDTHVTAEGHGLRVQLTWDGAGDVDLHLHRGTATPWGPGQTDDCHYGNTNPRWNPAQAPMTGENPSLDVDNVIANGPENIRIDTPVIGTPYTIGVHAFSATANARRATIEVFCGGVVAPNASFTSAPLGGSGSGQCTDSGFWKVATITFTSLTSCTINQINTLGAMRPFCSAF